MEIYIKKRIHKTRSSEFESIRDNIEIFFNIIDRFMEKLSEYLEQEQIESLDNLLNASGFKVELFDKKMVKTETVDDFIERWNKIFLSV